MSGNARGRPAKAALEIAASPAAAKQWTEPDSSAQGDLFDAAARRDDGADKALSAVHTTWRIAAEAAMKRLIYSGRTFTSDDLHSELGDIEAGHPNSIGALFLRAAKAGEIEPMGWEPSRRVSSHARPVRRWRRAGGAS